MGMSRSAGARWQSPTSTGLPNLAAIDRLTNALSAWAKVWEAAFAPAQAIAAELRVTSPPDIAMLAVPGYQSVCVRRW